MLSDKVYDALRLRVWRFFRRIRNHRNRKKLHNDDISIISMNCTGGILYHDLGLQFQSPTINMYMQAEDFIRFCENMDYYLQIDIMKACHDPVVIENRTYPVAWLGDIKLFLVHYSSVEEAQQKWNERKHRVQKDKIIIIATDRDGMTESLKNRFEKLPYSKIIFVRKPDFSHPNSFYLKGYDAEDMVGIITEPIGWCGRRPIDQFNFVGFVNNSISREREHP